MWNPPLLDTENEAEGDRSPTGIKCKKNKTKNNKNNFGGVSPPFHLDAVFTSRLPFIVEFSNIMNMKFKYIDFYLVYRYLLNFSVNEFVCECV